MQNMEGLFTSSILSAFLFLLQISLPVYSQSWANRNSGCRTPKGAAGNCVNLAECEVLTRLIQERLPENYAYLRQSQCGFVNGNPMVCCPSAVHNRNTDTTQSNIWNLSSNPHLPADCGEDLSQRIFGGERTDLYEFPWMALLEYTKSSGVRTTACGGVLISKRYVLTAAHCIMGKDLPRSWNLVSVRLGEYDTNSTRDCLPNGDGAEYCADEPITVGVEEQIAHEDYNPHARDQANDIALLRLVRNVAFTGYIRPICLPPSTTADDTFFHVAGWGKTETRFESSVKLKLRIPLASNDQCRRVYRTTSITIRDSQICAGGERGRDTCTGDSGGPLMAVRRTGDNVRWTSVGIVSFGPALCGTENFPGVYTRVTSFVPWILSKIRA